jgi:hypothetical protein
MQKFVTINSRSSICSYISMHCGGIQTNPSESQKLIYVESTNQQPIDQPHSAIPAQQYTEQYLAACRVDPMPKTPNGASATSYLASSYA